MVKHSSEERNKRIRAPFQSPFWYKIHVGECPVCGSQQGYRERQYTPKPENIEDRYVYLSDTVTYDGCDY